MCLFEIGYHLAKPNLQEPKGLISFPLIWWNSGVTILTTSFINGMIILPHKYDLIREDRREALLNKARRNPRGLQFREFEQLLRECGWTQRRQRGSHRAWYSPNQYRLIIQPRRSMAKDYQVRQFLRRHDQETKDG